MSPRTIAGRYVVDRAVGRGGMGTVWLCRDQVLGRQVAVKQVGAMPGETTSDVARALREARSSAALNHPNVVAVYDAVEDESGNWLVMEYVPSRTLAEVIASEGPLDPVRVAGLGAQAADGLAAAHARGTVHRDVKPGNVLVTDDDHVKITDFGISRTHGDVELTRTGLITGTPAYFSPETARGGTAGPPADVWALGATLYAAVEGHGPFPDRDNALALLNAIVSEPVPTPPRGGPLTEPIARMMEQDPGARWSMSAAAASLHELHQQRPASRPAPVAAPAATPVATPAAAPAAAPVAAPVAVGHAAPAPEPRSSRRRAARVLAAVVALVLLGAGVAALLGRGDDPVEPSPAAQSPAVRSPAPSAPSSDTAEPSPDEESSRAAPTTTPPAPTASRTPSGSAPAAPAGDAGAFAEQYYGLLPQDPRSAYALLSPTYRESTSYGEYQGFWQTIDAVEVGGTTVAEDGTTVDVLLTYTTGGGSQDETRRLYLEPTDAGYVIGDDEAV